MSTTFVFGALLVFGTVGYEQPVCRSAQVCVCAHALNGTRQAKRLQYMHNLSTLMHSIIHTPSTRCPRMQSIIFSCCRGFLVSPPDTGLSVCCVYPLPCLALPCRRLLVAPSWLWSSTCRSSTCRGPLTQTTRDTTDPRQSSRQMFQGSSSPTLSRR